MLAFLKEEGMGGHPIKSSVLNWLSANPQSRIPTMAKAAAVGQKVGNTVLGFVPKMWRDRFESPLFSGKGPNLGLHSMYNELGLEKGGYFVPKERYEALRQSQNGIEAVLYFPGCGGSLFYRKSDLPPSTCSPKPIFPLLCPNSTFAAAIPSFLPERTAITGKILPKTKNTSATSSVRRKREDCMSVILSPHAVPAGTLCSGTGSLTRRAICSYKRFHPTYQRTGTQPLCRRQKRRAVPCVLPP